MNLNKVFLIGNLTRDVELRATPSGTPVATLGVATNRVWRDQAGQKKEEAEFHNVVVWGRQAELANQYLSKGRMVMIEGRLRTRNWDDKTTGQKRYKTEIVAERIQFGPRFGGAGASPPTAPRDETTQSTPVEPLEEINLDEEPPAGNQTALGDIPF